MDYPVYYVTIDDEEVARAPGNPSKANRVFNSYVKNTENNTHHKITIELFVSPPGSDEFTRKKMKKLK